MSNALNEARDKVKYLENLRRHLEQLGDDVSIVHVINHLLPAIASNIRQTDSSSRYYARTGYLGLICAKVDHFYPSHRLRSPTFIFIF